MMYRSLVSLVAAFCLLTNAQDSAIMVQRPTATVLVRPWVAATVPTSRMTNSERLRSLIRAGKLYLTVQDTIALAIENNLDLEVDRYGPIAAGWAVERAEAGGVLRGVTAGNSQVGQTASGQGVSGSQRSAGLGGSSGGSSSSGGGATVSQIGPVTENLDPVLKNTTLFSHQTSPQVNAVQSETTSLVDDSRLYNTSLQEGLLTGGFATLSASESYLNENSPTDVLNPSVAPSAQLYIQHSLLRGFGLAVNSRFIRVAKNDAAAADFTFRSQLLNLVAGVLNLYWDLVSDNEDVKAKQHALEVAQKFLDDTSQQIRLGVLARVEVYRAESEVATRKRELIISQTTVRQQETLLKNAISRNGVEDPLLDAAEIVPLDSIQIPASDDLPPLRELVARALAKRPDFAVTKLNLESAEISALGTANGLLPNLQVAVQTWNSGLAGSANPPSGLVPSPQYVGGLGTAFGQVFRRDYANEAVGGEIVLSFQNRVSQGDYGVDQLQLRQNQLAAHRDRNQLVVDISNQMVGLRQARARYSAAVDTRALQEQLLEKEQQKFTLGGSTLNDLITAQRALADARTAEVAALATYSRARVALDQVLGETLEANHVSADEALKGQIAPAPARRETRINKNTRE
jgi:outer membrane protein TolC